ncbi:hypothetical protein DXB65_09285 [Bacteroides oleiciplenus]|uniref:Uncharacterized protein n=1 Tax=Bacteroides oleiciplenus TaxID=626931 RepID=A0A3E5BG61_9BACE|nr:hypothetical protein DXB65_09285 [Bacteroides oleiciplenus]
MWNLATMISKPAKDKMNTLMARLNTHPVEPGISFIIEKKPSLSNVEANYKVTLTSPLSCHSIGKVIAVIKSKRE